VVQKINSRLFIFVKNYYHFDVFTQKNLEQSHNKTTLKEGSMKVVVIIASALFAFTASAGEYSKPSSVIFQSASTFVPATKVCRDGDVLKHKTKAAIELEICEESDSGSKYNCKTVSRPLAQPVVSTAQRCAQYESDSNGGDCLAWETYTLNQASVKVWTYLSKKDMADGRNGSVTGTYTIPACATAGGAAN
jgi:hypothetical protein